MKQILMTMLEAMCDHPEDLYVSEYVGGSLTVLEIGTNPEDRCHVIGRQGRNLKAIRTIMIAIATNLHTKVIVEMLDPRDGAHTSVNGATHKFETSQSSHNLPRSIPH